MTDYEWAIVENIVLLAAMCFCRLIYWLGLVGTDDILG